MDEKLRKQFPKGDIRTLAEASVRKNPFVSDTDDRFNVMVHEANENLSTLWNEISRLPNFCKEKAWDTMIRSALHIPRPQ